MCRTHNWSQIKCLLVGKSVRNHMERERDKNTNISEINNLYDESLSLSLSLSLS